MTQQSSTDGDYQIPPLIEETFLPVPPEAHPPLFLKKCPKAIDLSGNFVTCIHEQCELWIDDVNHCAYTVIALEMRKQNRNISS